jgi:hypothetical protein
MYMSQVTNSYFAKYFCDIYFEYITPYTVMIYAMSDAIWITSLRLHTLCSGATIWSDWVDNITNDWQRGNWLTLLSYFG